MSKQPNHSPKPTNEALQAAIHRHVTKAAQTVSRIPPQQRTILTKTEAQSRQAGAAVHG